MIVGILENLQENQLTICGEGTWIVNFDDSMALGISKIPFGKIILTQAKNFFGQEFISGYIAVFQDCLLSEINKVKYSS